MGSYEYYIAHYGIKGQKKGRRRFQNEDGTLTPEGKDRYLKNNGEKDWKKLNKDAAKDAKEYARAKAFYGEGAGNRRKKIKNLTSQKMRDPDYKREFERQLSLQDMESHQKAANRERKAKDVKNSTAKTARGIKNFFTGNVARATVSAIAIGAVIKYTGADKKIAEWGRMQLPKVGNKLRYINWKLHGV